MSSEITVVYEKPEDLNPYGGNAREHSDEQINQIIESITEFGFLNPVILGKDKLVLAGHGRLEASLRMKLDVIPTIPVGHLSERQQKAFVIADNKIAENSRFDFAKLGKELDALVNEDYDIEVLGFNEQEIDAILKDDAGILPEDTTIETRKVETTKLGRADEQPPKEDEEPQYNPKKAVTEKGQVWQLGKHRLMCGDSTSEDDVALLFDGKNSIDVIITDPPYCSGGFNEAQKATGSIGTDSTEKWGGERPEIANDALRSRGYKALLKTAFGIISTKLLYCFTDWRMWVQLFDIAEAFGFTVKNMVVWDKETVGMGQGWRTQHELILVGTKGRVKFDLKKGHGNVISAKRSGNKYHPTQKPVDVIETILNVSSMIKNCYDPFNGSGTVLISCEENPREIACFGMEMHPYFCDATIIRWQELTEEDAVLVGSGQTFDELREERYPE